MITLLRTLSLALLLVVLACGPARAQWRPRPEDGGALLAAALYADPTILPDGAGGVFAGWASSNGHPTVQRLGPFGESAWAPAGIEIGTVSTSFIRVATDGAGGALFVWANDGSGTNRAIRAQRVGATGSLAWTAGGVVISSAVTSKKSLAIVADGAGGFFAAWSEAVVHGSTEDPPVMRVQHVNASGTVLWGASGLRPSALAGEQGSPSIVRDGADGIIVTWADSRIGAAQVFAQRYNASGTALWTVNGVAATPAASGQQGPVAAADASGGAIVAWSTGSDVRAQRYGSTGALQWTTSGVALCTASGAQLEPSIAPDGSGGAVVSWSDYRNANGDVYAQRVSASGTALWTANGVSVASGSLDQHPSVVTTDASGNVTIAFGQVPASANIAIYAQRLDAAGSPLWTAGGVAVTRAAGAALGSAVATDADGAVFIAWLDEREASSTRIAGVQRLDAAGYLGNPAPRILSVRDLPLDQGHQLKVTWAASWLDTTELGVLASYQVERWDGGSWTLLKSPPAGRFGTYSAVVATLADSTSPGSPFTRFRVRALDGVHTWDSAPDSGRSHDDLAPASPLLSGELVAGTTHLAWRGVNAPDLAAYRVYRGTTPDFATDASAFVAETRANAWSETASRPAYWKVTARDASGNESAPATWSPPGVTVAADAPAALAFAPPSPSPARERSELAYTLPIAGRVTLRLFDVTGREVRALVDGVQAAGPHACTWDLCDARGRAVPAGAYFARVAFAGEVRMRRVLVVR